MKMKVYISKSRVNCGPCSFINLAGLKGNKKLEEELASTGKLKPFKLSDYTSFLVWAKKYQVPLEFYTASKKIDSKLFKSMFRYENISKKSQSKYKKKIKSLFGKRNKLLGKNVILLKNPIKKLDELLHKNYLVAVGICNAYLKNSKSTSLHWVVAFKKIRNKYYFMDSGKGITISTKKQLKKAFKISKKQGFPAQLVAYKK